MNNLSSTATGLYAVFYYIFTAMVIQALWNLHKENKLEKSDYVIGIILLGLSVISIVLLIIFSYIWYGKN